MGKADNRALKLLSIIIFLLFVAPKVNLKIGPLPIYLIDILIFFLFVLTSKIKKPKVYKLPFKNVVIFILFMIIASELYAGILMGTLLKPIYIAIRMLLAGSLFFSVNRIIGSEKDLFQLLYYALPAALFTSVLLIMSSISFTRPLVTNIFSIPYLEPASKGVVNMFSRYDTVIRGRSLIGVSILSGAFLNTLWPLLLLLQFDNKISVFRAWLVRISTFLIPIAVVMTYSRGAILGLFMVIFGVSIFQGGRNRRLILAATLAGVLFFSWIGWDSEYFFFSRIEERLEVAFNNPYQDDRETERIYAYTQPFEHLFQNPHFLLIGYGFARSKVTGHILTDGFDAANHAVFAAAYYAYGMLTAITLVFLLLVISLYTFRYTQIKKPSHWISNKFNKAVLASILGFYPWFAFGHAAVSQPRGAMLFFFLLSMVAYQKSFFRKDYLSA